MLINAHYYECNDVEGFVSPIGWNFELYSFAPKSFSYNKLGLEIFPGCRIDKYIFNGSLRLMGEQLKGGGLQIEFIDSYSPENSLLGQHAITSVVLISLPGSSWDAVSHIKARGIEVNFDKLWTDKIFGCHSLANVPDILLPTGVGRSVMIPLTKASSNFRNVVLSICRLDKKISDSHHKPSGKQWEYQGGANLLAGNFDPLGGKTTEEAFVEMAQTVIGEACEIICSGSYAFKSAKRRELALKIEKELCNNPRLLEGERDLSIGYFSERHRVSHRTIQIALQEQFGIGFVALRRIIRLHQVRRAILGEDRGNITQLATEFFFNSLGRFSRDYRDSFGLLPSEDLRRSRRT